MQRKTALILPLVLLTLSIAILSGPGQKDRRVTFKTSEGKVAIWVEVSDTPMERKRGLMNRSSLPEKKGMLFVYPDEEERVFWMKNTLIPLDIIFVDSNGTIVDIDRAYPEPGVPESELARYRSDSPTRYVIEVNQNFTRRQGIEEGDRVIIDRY